ncbi:MAG: hypothetical protein M3O71_05310 [Bacteroidota bacterium]|nr:hypothetical protein [Bacteroidota bacterium]
MTQESNNSGIEAFLIKYKIALIILSIICLLYFPVKIYYAPSPKPGHIFGFIGYLAGAVISFLIGPIVLLLYIIKFSKRKDDV